MKKLLSKSLAVIMVVVMALTAAPLGGFVGLELPGFKAEAVTITSYSQGDIIEFGWYPQSEVTDSALISALNSCDGVWISYNYYSGTGDLSDGNMTASDYMRYKDVTYGGNKYRGVVFDSYRPSCTGDTPTANYSYQDNNGYYTGTVYWFKYDPIQWRVLDPATGLVIAETMIDAQPYNNYQLHSGRNEYGDNAFWGSSSKTYYANNYAYSSIREWLNDDFLNTAFSSSQQSAIEYTVLDNSAFGSSYSAYDAPATTDKVYLLSLSQAQSVSSSYHPSQPSAYASCQGGIRGYWWLRTPHYYSYDACEVYSEVSDRYGNSVYFNNGIRPALNFNLNSDIFESDGSISFSSGEYTVKYGDTLILHADLGEYELPEGYMVEWAVTGTGATIQPSEDGLTCGVTCVDNGTVTVTARIVRETEDGTQAVTNADGEEIKAEQTITMKGGFFWKVISFFKNLFRINRIIEK